MKIVPGTAELVKEYYGTLLEPSARIYFLVDDNDHPIGAAGFIRLSSNRMFIFTEGKPEAYKAKKVVVQFTRLMLNIADQHGWTLVAERDESLPSSERFLEHLGFELNEDGEYVRWAV